MSLWGKRDDVEVVAPGREQADLSEPEKLRSYLQAADFDVLVNPAAITNLEQCPNDPELTRRVNTESPRVMAEVCREKGAPAGALQHGLRFFR